MKKTIKRLCILILIFVLFTIAFKLFSDKKTQQPKPENKETVKTISCTRTTRLENKPAYDRALSLIQERVAQQYAGKKFDYFPPELTNCIKINEQKSESMSGLEGYFIFNDEEIKDNYYPITVSSSYVLDDNITTALLLSHEITHVQQYIDLLNKKNELSCVEKEVNAFMSQMGLYLELNVEENSSVYYRLKNDKNLHTQIKMIDTMIQAGKKGDCFSKSDTKDQNYFSNVLECQDKYMKQGLREFILNSKEYKKQCNL